MITSSDVPTLSTNRWILVTTQNKKYTLISAKIDAKYKHNENKISNNKLVEITMSI